MLRKRARLTAIPAGRLQRNTLALFTFGAIAETTIDGPAAVTGHPDRRDGRRSRGRGHLVSRPSPDRWTDRWSRQPTDRRTDRATQWREDDSTDSGGMK